jgi:glutathione S-transferase
MTDNTAPLPQLIIGTMAFSSWSLRPWLLLKAFNVPFQETLLQFDDAYGAHHTFAPGADFKSQLAALSPSGKVPALLNGALVIWDSLAICEYVNERYLDGRGWPKDLATRALARAVVAEMHSGFAALRQQMPMNVLREPAALAAVSEATQADIGRITTLWRELLGRFQGPFLFGEFSIADCFFAPVATRLHHYGVSVGPAERGYIQALYQLPALIQWIARASETHPE